MGLIKAVLGSVVGTLSETWKDYFVCDSMPDNVLMVKGVKKGGGGSGDIITNGSGIVVNEGQCALIVDEGKILEVAAEPGNYTFDSQVSPSVFDGGISGISNTFKEMLVRFTHGGDIYKNQRVYYVNTKEIFGNMFGTATPIPFRIIDSNINLDVEMPIRCNGEYSFRIVNPLVFYQNVAGNKSSYFAKEDLSMQMKAEVLMALQPAFSEIAAQGIRYSQVPMHVDELAKAMNDALAEKWGKGRGIAFESIAINSVSMDPENEKRLRDLQLSAVNKDLEMAGATITQATADAMRDAANNSNGAMNGFVGMNMVQSVSGVNANQLFEQAKQQSANATDDSWICPKCGSKNNGNFCSTCGQARPQGKYCPKCGNPVEATDVYCKYCGEKLL